MQDNGYFCIIIIPVVINGEFALKQSFDDNELMRLNKSVLTDYTE